MNDFVIFISFFPISVEFKSGVPLSQEEVQQHYIYYYLLLLHNKLKDQLITILKVYLLINFLGK